MPQLILNSMIYRPREANDTSWVLIQGKVRGYFSRVGYFAGRWERLVNLYAYTGRATSHCMVSCKHIGAQGRGGISLEKIIQPHHPPRKKKIEEPFDFLQKGHLEVIVKIQLWKVGKNFEKVFKKDLFTFHLNLNYFYVRNNL